MFQHTAARRRLPFTATTKIGSVLFQHTAARRRLPPTSARWRIIVSFNTQPPEGGCAFYQLLRSSHHVSTHSRPKAAATMQHSVYCCFRVSTHSRPKAAANRHASPFLHTTVSTHSRPKAAAAAQPRYALRIPCFNTQPPEGGCNQFFYQIPVFKVSTHSRPKAAATISLPSMTGSPVSTHSRPKAAAPTPTQPL